MSDQEIIEMARKGINHSYLKKLKDEEVGQIYHSTLDLFDKIIAEEPEESQVSIDDKEEVYKLLNVFRDEVLKREGAEIVKLKTFNYPSIFYFN